MAFTASVLGASGYSGAELVRLLEAHPALSPVALSGAATAGRALAEVLPHVAGALSGPLVTLEEAAVTPADVCFSCLPSGALGDLLDGVAAEVIVDLSDDHRGDPAWVYGLTEAARDRIVGASRIANPGCYPTAMLLGVLPFARAEVVSGPVIVDALSGASGAGRKAEDHLGFSALHGNLTAYGTTEHRHVPEMEGHLTALGGLAATVSFTPHLVPTARGLLATIRAPLVADLDDSGALGVLQAAYGDEPFIAVLESWPAAKAVAGSNAVHVTARVDGRSGYLVVSVAIDNLGKGAAGQAVQNANLALGLEETAGLTAVGVWP